MSDNAVKYARWLASCKKWMKSTEATVPVPPTVVQEAVRLINEFHEDLLEHCDADCGIPRQGNCAVDTCHMYKHRAAILGEDVCKKSP